MGSGVLGWQVRACLAGALLHRGISLTRSKEKRRTLEKAYA